MPVSLVRAALQAGVSHHIAGRRTEAERAYRAVLKVDPRQPDALHLLGVLATESGEPVRGAALIRQALQAMPSNADAHSNLGNALRAAGELVAARRSYRRALKLKPTHVAAGINFGLTSADIGEHVQAISYFTHALTLDAKSFDARQGLAWSHRARGDLVQAEAEYRQALKLQMKRDLLIELSALLMDDDRAEEALSLLAQAEAILPADSALVLARGRCEHRLGDVSGAASTYRRALQLDPAAAPAWNDLGRALRAQGDQKEAELAFRQALTLDPDLVDARRNLALIGSTSSDEIEPLRAILASSSASEPDKVLAGFALGKWLDDEGRYDEAFERFDAANERERALHAARGRRFDLEALRRRVDRLIAAPARPLDAGVGAGSDLPVFIVGMPRSGTSLVEQIAASHSQVHGAGELRAIGRIARRLSAGGEDPEELAHAHLAHLSQLGGPAARVIDKMPDNAFFLGEITRLFPRARVIVCQRDERDTCLSNYFQLYTSGNTFSYALDHCAQRQVETSRLLDHWRHALSLRFLTVQYELLVHDHEHQCRRIIDFLELPWQPACLEFEKTTRIVTTASAWQVRQPLYASSVERWRSYARHLADLAPYFETAPS